MKHVAIIGGGASGIFSALHLKKLFNKCRNIRKIITIIKDIMLKSLIVGEVKQ